ncbi:MAG: ISNCY family transposase [Bacteroidota bacterium]
MRRGHKHRKKRPRQPHIGSLVQLDGSDHDWFEGRAPKCTLLVFIDDASNAVFMRFGISENTQDVLMAMRDYLVRYGIPAAVYVDRGSVFYHFSKTTNFVRACQTLGIRIIYANSPQAKGRVERANRTQQDRLVKIMRENGISSLAAANAFLEAEYLAEHNAQFAMPEGLEDIHRSADHYDLQNILCFEYHRCVRHDMTIQFRAKTLQILSSSGSLPLPEQYITLRKWLDGSLHLFWREQEVRWQYTSHQEPRKQPRELGKAETFDHPRYNKPVGKLKRDWGAKRGRK